MFILGTLICVLSSCGGNKMAKLVNLAPDDVVCQSGDSIYYIAILSLYGHDDKLYMADNTRGCVYVLDNQLSLSKIIGSRGRGHGEFLFVGHIEGRGDSLFVENGSGVSLFVDNEFSRRLYDTSKTSSGRGQIGSFSLKYAYNNGMIYYYPLGDKSEILSYNVENNSVETFAQSTLTDKQNKFRGHILSDGEYIYNVSQNSPYIEKFSIKGEHIDTYDYSGKFELLDFALKYVDEQESEEGAAATLVRDVVCHDGNLYMLLFLRDAAGEFISNKLLVVDTKKGSDFRLLTLDNGGYLTLGIFNDKLVLFDAKYSALKIYDYL